jgi:hypothetical protein
MNAYTSFPAEFEAVRPIYNVLIATTGTMWLINYISHSTADLQRQGARDTSGLCCNIAWESTVVLIYRIAATLIFIGSPKTLSIPLDRLVRISIYKYTKDEYIVSPRRQFGGLMRPSVSEHNSYAK